MAGNFWDRGMAILILNYHAFTYLQNNPAKKTPRKKNQPIPERGKIMVCCSTFYK